jgi:hypothetical protein
MKAQKIVVQGRAIPYEVENLNIYKLQYYTENPRINYVISKHPSEQVNDELIESSLLAMESTKDLIKDIEENQGLLEAILVVGNKAIEGNTRLCAYRRLHRRTHDDRWLHIRAMVIKDKVTEEDLFLILGNQHIKGKKPWDPFEKAAYIHRMVNQGSSIDHVAKLLSSHRTKVETMLQAYKLMLEKYLPDNGSEADVPRENSDDLKKFSYFDAMCSDKDLARRSRETPAFDDKFVGWVREGRIPKAQDVRDLSNILNNKKAQKVFLNTDPEEALEEAKQVLYWHKPDKMDGFYKKVNQFRELIHETEIMKIQEEVADNSNARDILRRCLKDFQRFCKDAGIC